MKSETTTLVFAHIPKTAGTTIYKILQNNYGVAERLWINSDYLRQEIAQAQSLPLSKQRQIKLVYGHGTFGLHHHWQQPITYMTFLRDPVERVISSYYYIWRTPKHFVYEPVTTQDMSLSEYVSSGLDKTIDNRSVRIFAEELDVAYGECTREMLDKAKEVVENQIAVVGFAHRFDESILLMKESFGWRWPYYQKHNVTPNRPEQEELSPQVLQEIRALNHLDIELYQFAEQLFDQKLQTIPNREAWLQRFKQQNKIYSLYAQLRKSVANQWKSLRGVKPT